MKHNSDSLPQIAEAAKHVQVLSMGFNFQVMTG